LINFQNEKDRIGFFKMYIIDLQLNEMSKNNKRDQKLTSFHNWLPLLFKVAAQLNLLMD